MVARPFDRRGGFTLIEIMFVLLISCTVMMALGTLFVGSHRLMRRSYGVARASLDLRAEREHLLFHSVHEGGNVFWGGLLSSWELKQLSETKVRCAVTGLNLDRPADQGPQSSSHRHDRERDYPDGNEIRPLVDEIEFGFADGDLLRDNGKLYAVTLTRTVPSTGVTMRDRVVVPVFGTTQATDSLHVFHDKEGGQ